MTETYTYRELVTAYLQVRRYADWHADLEGFHRDKFRVLNRLFGVPEDWPDPESHDPHRGVLTLFWQASEIYDRCGSPFQGFLVASDEIHELHARFGRDLSESSERHQRLLFDLMCDIFAQVYGGTEKSFTSADLLAHGFDDSNPPNEWDYY